MSSIAYFQAIKPAILAELKQAKAKVQVAVAWFTDRELFAALVTLLQRQVEVSLLIRNDYVNNRDESLPWQQFIDAGGRLYFSPDADALHHKFCLIDNRLLMSGSYNWTYMAEQRNQENCVFSTDPNLLKQFQQEYQRLTKGLAAETQPARIAVSQKPETAYLTAYATTDQALQEVQQPMPSLRKSLWPDDSELHHQAYQAMLDMRYTEAVVLLERILATDPADAQALDHLAICFLYLKKFSDVITVCLRAERASVADSSIYDTLGQAYNAKHEYTRAIESFNKSVKLRPWSSIALFNKWEILKYERRTKERDACHLELLRVIAEGLESPHPQQDGIDIFFHHLHLVDLQKREAGKRKAAIEAQRVYDSLPEDQRDKRLQLMINELKLS
ncbi:phospholipase D-like domain-containing protein [Hymenobacter psychrophilus]|uniref:phospholipase D n=1 Tax=Hymenobacter psychrophilus TaxID=651662 RepID=A0A1H3NFX3_9BACT|nr:phospholipase D-like domain-containing protein [Hymenobacter psychrophilus]SDY87089.1 PLD-like domain-containing protein [Hymenobacter psychrophilus]